MKRDVTYVSSTFHNSIIKITLLLLLLKIWISVMNRIRITLWFLIIYCIAMYNFRYSMCILSNRIIYVHYFYIRPIVTLHTFHQFFDSYHFHHGINVLVLTLLPKLCSVTTGVILMPPQALWALHVILVSTNQSLKCGVICLPICCRCVPRWKLNPSVTQETSLETGHFWLFPRVCDQFLIGRRKVS